MIISSIIFCIVACILCYFGGYKNDYIDGRLKEFEKR